MAKLVRRILGADDSKSREGQSLNDVLISAMAHDANASHLLEVRSPHNHVSRKRYCTLTAKQRLIRVISLFWVLACPFRAAQQENDKNASNVRNDMKAILPRWQTRNKAVCGAGIGATLTQKIEITDRGANF